MKCLQLTAKSWLLGSGTEDGGLLFNKGGSFLYLSLKKRIEFATLDDVASAFGGLSVEALRATDDAVRTVGSYPVRHNDATVVSEQPPLYKRTNGVVFAAGYWAVMRESGWMCVFCPKQDSIADHKAEGPFRSRLEALNRISSINHNRHIGTRT
jgi:hypothetical protein